MYAILAQKYNRQKRSITVVAWSLTLVLLRFQVSGMSAKGQLTLALESVHVPCHLVPMMSTQWEKYISCQHEVEYKLIFNLKNTSTFKVKLV